MVRRMLVCLGLPLLLLAASAAAQTTSTLAAETGDNTSVGSFPSHDNGNVAAGNVSKIDTHTLLYSGATTRVYAHFLPWFCSTSDGGNPPRCNGHVLTGYDSNDAAEVKAQVDDMVSRGMQGMVIDWYGPYATAEDGATMKVMAEAQSRSPLFEFAIMEDKGAVSKCVAKTGHSNTQCAIDDLNYVAAHYYPSPAYMHRNGRPVVLFFVDTSVAIDWNAVRAGVTGNPLFVFEDNFTRTQADGAFAWVKPAQRTASWTQPDFVGYLDNFYGNARSHAGELPFGAGFKGFDDVDATWAPNPYRFMDQGCGQTWLQSIATVNGQYSASNQLDSLQLVTWNDYDEGTEIESGVDNCLGIAASLSGTTLSWTLSGSGQESTLDRYRIWSSADGQSLTLRKEVTAGGAHSVDTTTLGLGSDTTLYVQAVGKPSILNQMSNAVATSGGPPPRGVAITTPANGATVSSPIHVVAHETSGTATDMQIYLDGSLVYDQASVTAIDTTVAAGAGSHHVTVKAWYADGSNLLSAVDVTVSGPPPRGVAITTPADGASVTSPIHVVASETSGTATDMQIYLDGGLVYDQANVTAIDTTVAAGTGSRQIAVKAWYADGSNVLSIVNVTVTSTAPVTISQPSDGSSITSEVHVVASENTSRAATSMQIYLDSTLVNTTYNVDSLDTYVNAGCGARKITVKAWYADGTNNSTAVNVTVIRSNLVTAPAAGATVASPVHVVSTSCSDHPVTATQIYLDNVLKASTSTSSLDQSIAMSSGAHCIVGKGWDSAGNSFRTTDICFTVP
ncbi:MAG TPA: hypothetical protein VIH93_09315 [Thermoanaerobaculia bacterium]